MVELADSVIVFVVGLLLGAFGIYVGGRAIAGVRDYTHALVTALVGALAWAIASFLFGGIPFLGPLIAFLAYLAVVNWRYPGGWGDAVLITLVAWVAVAIVLYVLAYFDLMSPDAVGVPLA